MHVDIGANGLRIKAQVTLPLLSSVMVVRICCLSPTVSTPSSWRSLSVSVRNASISTLTMTQ